MMERMPPGSRCAWSFWNHSRVNRPQSARTGQVREDRVERAGLLECVSDVGDLHDDPVIGEARLVPGDELGARKGQDFGVVVDQADRRDCVVPEQLADEQAVAAAEH